jgi:xanthine dehydrogenase accessory factor
VVLGAGEVGSAVAHRLARAGMTVFAADLERPTCLRRGVCFAAALGEGSKVIEGVTAVRADTPDGALKAAGRNVVPVIAIGSGDRDYGRLVGRLACDVLVDARMLKRNQGMSRAVARLVVGLGPGFKAPRDVHAAVETNRGHYLGRVIYDGEPEPDTGVPAGVDGHASERVIRAPADGVFTGGLAIGRQVSAGEPVGATGDGTEVRASIAGLLRGLVADGTPVARGQKIGDIDPRGAAIDPFSISDKGRAVAGGVLEAIMTWWTEADARL